MTCRLVTPWWLDREAGNGGFAAGGITPTRILDWESASVRDLVAELTADDAIRLLQQAHGLIATRVRPVYAVDDSLPASKTLVRGRGSCSQRLAVLEAVARSVGIATRVRGLLVDGAFWYPRFPRLRFAVPDAVVLAWPEFSVDGTWVTTSEIFGPLGTLSGESGFSNADGETLFEAVSRTAVDWDGVTSSPGACSACDLSATVLRDFGHFDSRDDLFATHGQTLCWGARTMSGAILGRWSAGAGAHV
jgi:hypothetical protein